MKFCVPRRSLALLACAALLAACASAPPPTTVMLTYETKPEGATLFEGGQSIGAAPVTRTYAGDGKGETVRTPLVTAVWPSGAKESYYTILPLGADRVATIERPAGAPGLQADMAHAAQVTQARELDARKRKDAAMREQARGSERCRQQMAGRSLASQDDC